MESAENADNREEFEKGLEQFEMKKELYSELVEKIWQRLLWVATPESIVRSQHRENAPEFVEKSRLGSFFPLDLFLYVT